MEAAIEAKATARITGEHLRGLRDLEADHPGVKKRLVVCLESKERKTEDGILVCPSIETDLR